MEDKKIIELNATDRDLLVFSTPREATDSMLKELNALPNVDVTKLKLESDIIKDGVDLSTALKAEAIIQKYMKPMKEYLNELVSKEWYKKQPSEIRSVIIRNVIKKYHKNGTAIFKQKNKQFQEDIRNKFKTSMGIE